MARYIDETLVNAKLKEICENTATTYGIVYGGRAEKFERLTEDIPTADVVEVVRCKDCVDYIPDADLDHEQLPNDLEADGYCDNWLKYTDAHCFCSSGRKKMKERF